jgi:RHS repeat-associated protein
MLDEIHHANGTVYGQGLDEHWMRRPASLWIVHPTNNNLTLVEGDPDPPGTPHPYAYDGAGNVKSWSDWRYRYDAVSRVLEGAVVGGESQSYTYDPFGNILTIGTGVTGDPDPPTVQLGVDPATNRLSASTYDAAGNLIIRGPFSYGYDSLSMMQTMMQTMDGGGAKNTYIYTADNERIWTVDSSVSPWNETFTLRHLDGKVLRVFTTSDELEFTGPTEDLGELAWSQDYIYRDGQLLATVRLIGENEEAYHFHLNHLGTPLLITDPEGATEALHSYFPFGEELTPNNDTERMKFTGHERDFNKEGQTDDLDYMHARYYGPMMGRFLSVDPRSRYRPMKAPQQWNRYAYALGNPLKFLDPDGEVVVGFTGLGNGEDSGVHTIVAKLKGKPHIGDGKTFRHQDYDEAVAYIKRHM